MQGQRALNATLVLEAGGLGGLRLGLALRLGLPELRRLVESDLDNMAMFLPDSLGLCTASGHDSQH